MSMKFGQLSGELSLEIGGHVVSLGRVQVPVEGHVVSLGRVQVPVREAVQEVLNVTTKEEA